MHPSAVHLSPDQIIYWQYGIIKLNATIAYTWLLMLVLVAGSAFITHHLSQNLHRSRWQNILEIVVATLAQQLKDLGLRQPRSYLGFLGTLFLLIAGADICTIFPGFEPPTGSLSTTTALALCVFIAVPMYGIRDHGVVGYLKTYTEPTLIMLPFNLISELSRTLALAVRLFGNMMSGAMIIAILLVITPFVFPIVMTLLGLLTGLVQAYIFFVLAAVYIAAATEVTAKPTIPKPTASKPTAPKQLTH